MRRRDEQGQGKGGESEGSALNLLMLSSLIAQRTDEATSSFSQVSEQICIVGAILSRRRRSGLFNFNYLVGP